jgi:hypothetical protein
MGKGRSVYRVLVGRPEGKKLLARPRRRWEDNINMDLREIGINRELDSAGSGYGPVAGFCEHGNKLSGSIKNAGCCLTS